MAIFKNFRDNIKELWQKKIKQPVDEEEGNQARRERIIVFSVAFVLALGLWFLVNMSRDYSLDIKMPIQLGNIPDEKALASDLPESASVSLQGEGWKLVSVYNNPPEIYLNVTEDKVNLYEQVRDQLNAKPTLTVLKVNPLNIEVELDERISRKVPVTSNISVGFKNQYDFLTEPRFKPDSVVISGANSRLQQIDSVSTKSISLEDVSQDINRPVPLKGPELVSLSRNTVQYQAQVAEFTEGEANVYVQANNVPPDKKVTFSPPTVTIRYYVPIHEYKEASEQKPFTAYVNYRQIERDSTGYVSPQVVMTNADLSAKIRSYQPNKLSYYHVLGGN